jgi:hypothetical protein
MMSRASLAAIAVLFLYGAPADALTKVAPPGNAGATQYQEDVPSAGGGVPVTNLPTSRPPGAAAVPHRVTVALDHAGTAGRATAQLAGRTAPAARGSGQRGSPTASGHPGASAGSGLPRPESVTALLGDSVFGGSGGGLGPILPIVIFGSLSATLALILMRRRRPR